MIVHENRVALRGQQFVLFPTLSGVLPPFPDFVSDDSARWLSYLAPEVIRTRAKTVSLLFKSDVYSLGRMLYRLLLPTEPPVADPFETLEAIVEKAKILDDRNENLFNAELQKNIARMCAFFPADRPDITEVMQLFETVYDAADPERHIGFLISAEKLAEAEAAIDDLEAATSCPAFAFSKAKLYLLRSQLALHYAFPQFALAIEYLRKAQKLEPLDISIDLRIAETYLAYQEHPQHILFASEAYEQALALSNWRVDIMESWLALIETFSPNDILEKTHKIPWDKRLPHVFLMRAKGYLDLGKPFDAWNECVRYFEEFHFNEAIYNVSKAVAYAVTDPREFIVWKSQYAGAENLPALMSIVWEVNGNLSLAEKRLAEARGDLAKKGDN
jgi:tetratricopeptide (TPR) repeat protein